jgi:predicted ABC-type ATPase
MLFSHCVAANYLFATFTPSEDIRRRYARSLANLVVAIQQADSTSIFDNSTKSGHRQLLTIAQGRVTKQASELPEWIKVALPQEFTEPNQNQSTQ